MTTPWLISYLILWLLVCGIGFLLLGTLSSLGKLQWRLEQLEATRPKRKDREGLDPGKTAPDFTLPSSTGDEVSLSDYAGRRVLIVFTQAGCGPCHSILPELNRLQAKGTLEILVVNHGELEETWEMAREFETQFPVAGQEDWTISKLFKVFATPFGFVINENGVIAAKGVVSSRQFLQYVLSEADKQPRPAHDSQHRDSTIERDVTTSEPEKEITHA